MSDDNYCPHCKCDEGVSEPDHGPNCPRYRGPPPDAPDFSRIEGKLDELLGLLGRLVKALEKK